MTLFPAFFSNDGRGLKLEKDENVGPTFTNFNAMPGKITKNYFLLLSHEIFFDIYLLHNSSGAFFAEVEALGNDVKRVLTSSNSVT